MTPALKDTPTADRWYKAAYELTEGERWCTCCKRDLSGGAVRMLEMDQRINGYHDIGDVPADQSQGWFPFGMTCARKLVAKEIKRRASMVTSQHTDAEARRTSDTPSTHRETPNG